MRNKDVFVKIQGLKSRLVASKMLVLKFEPCEPKVEPITPLKLLSLSCSIWSRTAYRVTRQFISSCCESGWTSNAYQIVNKFVAVSVVTNNGMLQNKFNSSEEPCGHGADAILEAIKMLCPVPQPHTFQSLYYLRILTLLAFGRYINPTSPFFQS